MRFTAVVLGGTLLACSSVPKASPQLDLAAKTFRPPSGLARIYVYRLGKPWGLARYDSHIRIAPQAPPDGGYAGDISKRLYLYADVRAGSHSIDALTILYDEGHPKEIARNSLNLDTVEGSVYFVRVEVPGTWPVDPPEMRLVSADEGMRAVQDCQLARR